MISSKQVELGKMLFDQLRHRFPEVELKPSERAPKIRAIYGSVLLCQRMKIERLRSEN